MKLQCTYPHMANESILANGNTYTCDEDGVTEVPIQADADKILLDERGWRKYVAKEPVGPSQVIVKATGKPVVEVVVEEEPEEEEEPKVEVTAKEVKPKPVVEDPSAPVVAELLKEKDEWVIPAEGEEWPDPTEDMPIEYLRTMARAYKLQFHPNTGKAKILDKLNIAMFEEE